MVRKVAVPARSSVVKLVLRSVSLNRLPIRPLATEALRRLTHDVLVLEAVASSVRGGGDELAASKSMDLVKPVNSCLKLNHPYRYHRDGVATDSFRILLLD
ncbi:unnamed protein product [Cuscuta europaea]|uniref:Uncharacterized protein n=1 Tax=Cuscuta europaea TaxID=41803 RepID=A0A9P1EDI1_CUSEU|nr:unnamed protein product [Cuscuta europaea]